MTNSTEASHFDVVIIGAGISGINAAHELITNHPGKSFVILDALSNFGGTWLTHTDPGVRSDTELYTLGYSYKPWMMNIDYWDERESLPKISFEDGTLVFEN